MLTVSEVMLGAAMAKKSSTSPVKRNATRFAPGLGQRLKEARIRAGFHTQADLADAMGVRPLTINRIETGGADPGKSTIAQLVKALNVSETWLLYNVGGDTQTDAVEEVEAYLASPLASDISPQVRKLLQSFQFASIGAASPTIRVVDQVRALIELTQALSSHSTGEGR
jgi:transcriptional regulator with XRE-family HTH domain